MNTRIIPVVNDVNGVLIAANLDYGLQSGTVSNGFSGRFVGKVTTSSTTEVPIRQTAYVEQASNAQRSISSTSAADAAAGAGCRSVRLTYYGFAASVITGPFTEDITLNGVTPVNTVATNICFIESMRMLTVGTAGAANTGIIQIFGAAAGAGGVIASMAAGARRTFYGHHYIPNGKTCYLVGVEARSTAASGNTPECNCRFTNLGLANAAEQWVIEGVASLGHANTLAYSFGTLRSASGPGKLVTNVIAETVASQVQTMEVAFFEI